MYENKHDEDLVILVQRGDDDAFALLMGRYEKKLLRYARKFLFYDLDSAHDVIQDVFIKAFINIKSFNAARKFSPWIYRIAHNELINAIKKKRKEPIPFFDSDTLFPHPLSKEHADNDIKQRETRELIEQSLSSLGPKYREVLLLYYFEDMDYKDIADILRIPVSTVGVRLRRARGALKKIIKVY